jgi:hypothetical protein
VSEVAGSTSPGNNSATAIRTRSDHDAMGFTEVACGIDVKPPLNADAGDGLSNS